MGTSALGASASGAGAPDSRLEEPAATEKGKAKPAPPEKITAKVLAKIEASLEKYEQNSWEHFLREEEEFKKRLFAQFASADSGQMTTTEYHKMLMKWHRLARWCMPGELRPMDSLASLEYVLRRDKESRGAPGGGTESGNGPEDVGSAGDAKMPYRIWIDLLNGKHRPEEHMTFRPVEKH